MCVCVYVFIPIFIFKIVIFVSSFSILAWLFSSSSFSQQFCHLVIVNVCHFFIILFGIFFYISPLLKNLVFDRIVTVVFVKILENFFFEVLVFLSFIRIINRNIELDDYKKTANHFLEKQIIIENENFLLKFS